MLDDSPIESSWQKAIDIPQDRIGIEVYPDRASSVGVDVADWEVGSVPPINTEGVRYLPSGLGKRVV